MYQIAEGSVRKYHELDAKNYQNSPEYHRACNRFQIDDQADIKDNYKHLIAVCGNCTHVGTCLTLDRKNAFCCHKDGPGKFF